MEHEFISFTVHDHVKIIPIDKIMEHVSGESYEIVFLSRCKRVEILKSSDGKFLLHTKHIPINTLEIHIINTSFLGGTLFDIVRIINQALNSEEFVTDLTKEKLAIA